MATRSGGRNDDRSSQRSTGGSQRSTGAGSGNARGATSSGRTTGARGSSSSSAGVGASGRNASRASGVTPTTPRTTSSGQSTASRSDSSAGAASSTPTDREREVRTSRETGSNSAAGGIGTSNPGTSNAGASSSAGTSSAGTSSTAKRSGVGQATRSYPPQQQMVSGGGSTPFAMMRRMMDDMDRLFSEFGFVHPGQLASLLGGGMWPSTHTPRSLNAGSSGGSGLAAGQPRGQQGVQRGQPGGLQPLQGLWAPQVELFERGNNLVVRADLPGLSREDVDVEVDDDMLIIRGERRHELDDEQEGYYRSERSYGSFYRAVPLPDNVDPASCNATFKDGVLEVTLPKPQSTMTKAKRIEVR